MTDDPDFADFVRRIRAGDDAAAVELVRQFEPLIRREVRMRIGDDRLNRAFDSVDVTQSVFASFFTAASGGEFELDRPEQLAGLLMTMARNRLVSRARQEWQQVRDVRRLATEPGTLEQAPAKQPSPSQIASQKEQLELLNASLSVDEQQILELRSAGLSWEEVATQLGGSGHARRMQWSRSLDRLKRCRGNAD
jgi:RNA polymerase sigma-70 factor (ECF subfamily)